MSNNPLNRMLMGFIAGSGADSVSGRQKAPFLMTRKQMPSLGQAAGFLFLLIAGRGGA